VHAGVPTPPPPYTRAAVGKLAGTARSMGKPPKDGFFFQHSAAKMDNPQNMTNLFSYSQ
jgi:hypothetical protein